MNVKKAGVVITLTILVSVSIIPLGSAITFHDSDEYYFENANILILGRCSTITSTDGWLSGIFIGKQQYAGIAVHEAVLERVHIIIFNESIFNYSKSLPNMQDISVFMNNADGFFFWGGGNPHHLRLIPPIILIKCHAGKIWIY